MVADFTPGSVSTAEYWILFLVCPQKQLFFLQNMMIFYQMDSRIYFGVAFLDAMLDFLM